MCVEYIYGDYHKFYIFLEHLNEFTLHGLHMNISGKERLTKILRHHITTYLTKQNSPISLNWKEATSTDETKIGFAIEHAADVHKNPARSSCRPKKTQITRNEDFLWTTYTSKTV